MLKLLLLFVAIPAIELALLIEVGARIGTIATLFVIAATGVLGAALARWQGLGVLATIRRDLDQGRMPTGSIVDGVIILVAAAVLLTPGLLTDAFGFLCLVPATRRVIKSVLWTRFDAAVRAGRVQVHADAYRAGTYRASPPWRTERDITPRARRLNGEDDEPEGESDRRSS